MNTYGQKDITIGKTYTINSEILQEDRTIQIYLPKSYTDTNYSLQHYPVIYLLDGESNFNYLTAFVEKLSRNPYPSIPEMIIIGIVNTNRTRDLTPTTPNENSLSAEQKNKTKGETGGNSRFFEFIDKELMPFINEQYRTKGYNVLIGHSFGGITALNNLLNHTTMFQAYIVHDPSIWWDNQYILKTYKQAINKDFKHRKLFITQVDESLNKDINKPHYTGIKDFHRLMQNEQLHNLAYKYIEYQGEDHGSIPMKGNLDGLRYIFDGYKINLKDIKNNLTLVEDTYKSFSKKIHFEFLPSEAYLDFIINYYKQINNQEVVDYYEQYKRSLYN
ncbi:alpha/beta hydrolase [Myroides pelagicus]|nr:alpha/beta hydrolase-fold protein [Myroides pelagicus]MEC4113763.1 alpha/beta hydrolase-fold protein [Myroides pelagicus]